MKERLYLLACIFFFGSSIKIGALPDANIHQILKEAEQYYKQKNYSKAIECYQKVLQQHYESFELYYNLGNAYFRNNQLGKAILYYEKAKRLNASDADLNHNLQLAYSLTIDKIDTKDNFFIEITKNNFLNTLNTQLMAYFNILLSVLALVAFVLFLYNTSYRKISLLLSVLFTVSNLLLYGIAYIAEKNKHTSTFAIVTKREINMQNEPLPNAVTKFILHEGTKVKVLQKVDNFILVRLENGVEGWTEESAVERI